MDDAERSAWLRLTLTPGVGPRTAQTLLQAIGLPSAVFAAGRNALARVVPDRLAQTLAAAPDPAVSMAMAAAEAWLADDTLHALITLADGDYPQSLLSIIDPPPVLFAIGRRELLNRPALAIVGSRSCSQLGAQTAEAFAYSLARSGLTIVSGLALGIDAAAHRGALRAADDGEIAPTVAVLGTGIDVIYPYGNRALTEQIRARGIVLSELPLATGALTHNFPRRNRLLAGLARGVLVVEAALHSGSLISARLAAENGREVFAIPGSIHSPLSKGCHRLIREGAKLVDSAQDILEELSWGGASRQGSAHDAAPDDAGTPAQPQESALLSASARQVLAALTHDPIDTDQLATRTALDIGALSAVLLDLELAQHIERLPGNRYQRLR